MNATPAARCGKGGQSTVANQTTSLILAACDSTDRWCAVQATEAHVSFTNDAAGGPSRRTRISLIFGAWSKAKETHAAYQP